MSFVLPCTSNMLVRATTTSSLKSDTKNHRFNLYHALYQHNVNNFNQPGVDFQKGSHQQVSFTCPQTLTWRKPHHNLDVPFPTSSLQERGMQSNVLSLLQQKDPQAWHPLRARCLWASEVPRIWWNHFFAGIEEDEGWKLFAHFYGAKMVLEANKSFELVVSVCKYACTSQGSHFHFVDSNFVVGYHWHSSSVLLIK